MSLPIVKLTSGNRTLDINSGNYKMQDDFIPPAVQTTPLIASGTSANRLSGGQKVGQRANNIPLSFSLLIVGASQAEIDNANRLIDQMLSLAGNVDTPLFIEFRPNSDVAQEPKWGQFGANFHYEIIHAQTPTLWDNYHRGAIREKVSIDTFNLLLKPYALGNKQRLAHATGGMLENTLENDDGFSIGTQIPPATINLFANPIYANLTWDTDWSVPVVSPEITATENVDPEFVFIGGSSAKLEAYGATALKQTWTQSLTLAASDHIISCYAKLPDGSVISSTQIQLHYDGTDLTTTYTAVGNGWYRLTLANTDKITGTAGAALVGMVVKNGYTVYVDAHQVEQKSNATPFGYGDMMGWLWTGGGTPHSTTVTSTRVGARARVSFDSAVLYSQGTVRFVWKPTFANTETTADHYIFQDDNSNLQLRYSGTNNRWEFGDEGSATRLTVDDTFSANDIIIIHAVWEPGRVEFYKNGGVPSFTSGTYDLSDIAGTWLYIGSDNSAANHAGGTLMGFATYIAAMTDAEVLADYNNATQVTADNQRLESIPWHWSVDGDGISDNCLDTLTPSPPGSTNAPHTNYTVVNGIPGSVESSADYNCTLSNDWNTIKQVALSNFVTRVFADPANVLFHDNNLSGTGFVTFCGGGKSIILPTTTGGSSKSISRADYAFLAGKQFYIFFRIDPDVNPVDSDTNFKARPKIEFGGITIFGEYGANSASATSILLHTPSIIAPNMHRLGIESGSPFGGTIRIGYEGFRITATGMTLDYFVALPTPLIIIGDTSITSTEQGLFLRKTTPVSFDTGNNNLDEILQTTGQEVTLSPQRSNTLITVMGASSVDPNIQWTLTYNYVDITPRYSLL